MHRSKTKYYILSPLQRSNLSKSESSSGHRSAVGLSSPRKAAQEETSTLHLLCVRLYLPKLRS